MVAVVMEKVGKARRGMPDLAKVRLAMRVGANSFRTWFSSAA